MSIKFKTKDEAKLFTLEIGRYDLLEEIEKAEENFSPDSQMMELFIKRRQGLIKRLKDFRKSQAQRMNWRHNRYKIMKGIQTFHKSTTGKRFHRELGRFIATRYTLFGNMKAEAYNQLSIGETLKALSSLKTHAYIEMEYYHGLDDQVDYEIFLEELVPTIDIVEKSILSGDDIPDDDMEFFLRVVESSSLIKGLADKTGNSVDYVETLWKKAKKIVQKEYNKTEDSNGFYALVVGVLKKMLGIKKK